MIKPPIECPMNEIRFGGDPLHHSPMKSLISLASFSPSTHKLSSVLPSNDVTHKKVAYGKDAEKFVFNIRISYGFPWYP